MTVPLSETTTAFDPGTRPGETAAPPAEGQRRPARRRRFRFRTVLLLAALFGLVVLLAILFGPEPQPVDLASAVPGDVVVTVTSEGKTRVRQQYDITAPLAGRLRRVTLKAGDAVVANDTVVAMIDPPTPQFNDVRSQAELVAKVRAAESSLAQAQADLVRARSQLDFAEADVTRYRDLVAQGVTAKRSFAQYTMEADTRRAGLDVATKLVEQRKAELDQVHALQLGPAAGGQPMPPVQVRSPVSGSVLDVTRESETVVSPSQPILTIGDTADIEIVLEMLSEDAVKVQEGMRAILDGWGGAPLNARVRRVEPFSYTKVSALGIEEQRVHVLLDFTDPADRWRAMGHGYRVTGRIVTWEGKGVLTLPMGALFRDGSQWSVYALEDHVARLRHVTLGHLNQTEAEVLGGIEPGTEVILHPNDRIAEGVPVRPRT
ncbi:MAG: HlyD family efflux transporter periplasmic adaptor subunit [Acetobacteraceae bacterium]